MFQYCSPPVHWYRVPSPSQAVASTPFDGGPPGGWIGKSAIKSGPDSEDDGCPWHPVGRMSPLHIALENSSTPHTFIQAILLAAPPLIRAVDEDGALPLHYACSGEKAYGEDGVTLIRLLVSLFPEAAAVAEKTENATPLHYLLRLSGDVRPESIKLLLDAAYETGDFTPRPEGRLDEAEAEAARSDLASVAAAPAPAPAGFAGAPVAMQASPGASGASFGGGSGAPIAPDTTALDLHAKSILLGIPLAPAAAANVSSPLPVPEVQTDRVYSSLSSSGPSECVVDRTSDSEKDDGDKKPAARRSAGAGAKENENENENEMGNDNPAARSHYDGNNDAKTPAALSSTPSSGHAAANNAVGTGKSATAGYGVADPKLLTVETQQVAAAVSGMVPTALGCGTGPSPPPVADVVAAEATVAAPAVLRTVTAPTDEAFPALTVPVSEELIRYLLIENLLISLLPPETSAMAASAAIAPAAAPPVPASQIPPSSQETGTTATSPEVKQVLLIFLLAAAALNPIGGRQGVEQFCGLQQFYALFQKDTPGSISTTAAVDAAPRVAGIGAFSSEPLAGAVEASPGSGLCLAMSSSAPSQSKSCRGRTDARSTAKAAGGILVIRDRFEQTPLHHACCRPYTGADSSRFVSFVEIIQAILDDKSYPGAWEAAKLFDRRGRLPLHHVIDSTCSRGGDGHKRTRIMANPAAVSSLLEAYPGAASIPDGITGLSPVHLAYVSAPPRNRALQIDSVFHVSGIDLAPYRARQLWETIKALLLAAAAERDAGARSPAASGQRCRLRKPRRYVLHAVVRFPCPPCVFRAAILLHSRQARLRDSCGDLPLHTASRRQMRVGEDRYLWLPEEFVRTPLDGDGGSSRRRLFDGVSFARFVAEEKEEKERELLEREEEEEGKDDGNGDGRLGSGIDFEDELTLLVNKFSAGASYLDRDWRLPINLAIESGRSWALGGVRAIADAAPLALVTRDTKTWLYPFMLAAVGSNSDLTTVFELLKLSPAAVKGGLVRREVSRKTGHKRCEVQREEGLDEEAHKKQRFL